MLATPPEDAILYVKWTTEHWHVAPPYIQFQPSVAESMPVTTGRTYLQCGSDAPGGSLVDDKLPSNALLCGHCRKRLAKRAPKPETAAEA